MNALDSAVAAGRLQLRAPSEGHGPVFGLRVSGRKYVVRPSTYAVNPNHHGVAVVETPLGVFLPGAMRGFFVELQPSSHRLEDRRSTRWVNTREHKMSRRRIRQRRDRGTDVSVIAGAAWYSQQQWELLKRIAADPDLLEDSYEEWLQMAERGVATIRAAGQAIEKVDVDVEELIRWCAEMGRPVDAAARAAFAARLLQRRSNPGGAGLS